MLLSTLIIVLRVEQVPPVEMRQRMKEKRIKQARIDEQIPEVENDESEFTGDQQEAKDKDADKKTCALFTLLKESLVMIWQGLITALKPRY